MGRNLSEKADKRLDQLQYACILAFCGIQLLFLLPETQELELVVALRRYAAPLIGVVFLAAAALRGFQKTGWGAAALAAFMLLWIGFVFTLHTIIRHQEVWFTHAVACCYLIALPMAYAFRDSERQRGLTALLAMFLIAGLSFSAHGLMLYFGVLPESLSSLVFWYGERLTTLLNPIFCGTYLMVGIGACLVFSLKTPKKWLKAVLLLLAAVQFLVMLLTDCRASIASTFLLVGGTVLCSIRKSSWKRLLPAAIVCAAVVALLFVVYKRVSPTHRNLLDSSFNGRIAIWRATVSVLREEPRILLTGCSDVLSERIHMRFNHAHNSFLQTTYVLGIPGLLAAIGITLLALRGAIITLWRNDCLWKSCLALLAVSLFLCGMMEVYLFITGQETLCLCFCFLTLTGYLHSWCPRKAKQ